MLEINGYTLKVPDLKTLVRVFVERGVETHTVSEGKALLRIARYLGVKHLQHFTSSHVLEMNVPSKAEANRVYSFERVKGEVVIAVGCSNTAVGRVPVSFPDVVSGKTLINWIRDM